MSDFNEYWKGFQRAIGLRASFRRTGASSLGNIAFAAFVGVVSGHFIFAEPLRQYWAEEAMRRQQVDETNTPSPPSQPKPSS